jgi:hypothetical protein
MHTLYTMGYASTDPAKLLDWAQVHQAIVADVRFKPYARDARWREDALRKLLGDRYQYLHAWGNVNYKGDKGPDVIFADWQKGAQRVQRWLEKQPVCLLCGCWDLKVCHRREAAQRLQALWPDQVNVEHIDLVERKPEKPKDEQLSLL